MQDSSAVQHSVDSLTGQSATPCRSARPHRYPDAGRQTASGLESAVEPRLGEKSARQSQNLVSFAQFPNFTLQCFYPVALGAGNAIAHARVDLVLTHPIMQGLRNTPYLGAMDSMVAHKDEYSPRCSNTIARSRTSGENLFDFFMAPFSQMLEPPQNPGRFKVARMTRSRLSLSDTFFGASNKPCA